MGKRAGHLRADTRSEVGEVGFIPFLGGESQTRYDRSGRVTDQVTKGTGYEVGRRAYEWDLSGKLRRLTAGKYTAEFDYDVVGTLAAARYDETEIVVSTSCF